MSPSLSIAANLSPDICQKLAIEVLSKPKPVSHLATEHQVSRKFVYRQGNKAAVALTECFEPSIPDDESGPSITAWNLLRPLQRKSMKLKTCPGLRLDSMMKSFKVRNLS
jgi:hypothetical protein